jgi:pyruvate formate lyase activating enzyme
MKFSGLQKTSLLDYPDKVASVLFTPGCNLRCPYCHNWQIATNPQPPFLAEGLAMEVLESRKKYVDAVVVTGGEPCMHKELPKFLAKLKEKGFFVKLDTNGFYPEILQECLGSLDYVAMDVKTSPEKYKQLGAKDAANVLRSIEMLKAGKVPYEFRITVVPEIVTAQDIATIADLIKGAPTCAIQQFINVDTLDKRCQTIKPYPPETLQEYAEVLKKACGKVILRI